VEEGEMRTSQPAERKAGTQHLTQARIEVPPTEVAMFCRRHHMRRLALFGSVLRDDFRPESDIDVLVEFEPGHVPGLIRLAGMELEFSALLGGRKVDMNTPWCLSPYFRDEVLAEAEVLYAEA
jgi:predicted nucleotidyltransferase